MEKQTVDIFDEIVQTMSVEFIIDNVIDNGDGTFTLESKCTSWLAPGCEVTIGAVTSTIKTFVINKSITITAAVAPVLTSFTIPAPTFLHGTLKMAKSEVNAQVDKEVIFPMCFFLEPIRDVKNNDDESTIDRDSSPRLFWIQQANTGDWLTDDHYLNLIDPMQQMVDLFILKISTNKFFIDEFTYDRIPLTNISEDGKQLKSLFDCDLSGIETPLRVQIREDLSCVNICGCSN